LKSPPSQGGDLGRRTATARGGLNKFPPVVGVVTNNKTRKDLTPVVGSMTALAVACLVSKVSRLHPQFTNNKSFSII